MARQRSIRVEPSTPSQADQPAAPATPPNGRPNLFHKAANKAAEAPTTPTKTKETTWYIKGVPDDPSVAQLDSAVTNLIKLERERKTLETKAGVFKKQLRTYANGHYVDHVVETGVQPQSPLKVVNSKGESVTFVVQDRGHLTKVKDPQLAAITELIGEEGAAAVVYDGGDFVFNPDVLCLPGVQDAVGEAVGAAIAKLVEDGKLTQDQGDNVLTYEKERRFKPGCVSMAPQVCGRSKERIEKYLDLLQGAATRYVKV